MPTTPPLQFWPWFALAVAYGACVGSFVNVVVVRLPDDKPLSRPRSRCVSCGHRIRWYENVPLLAWLILRGRCRKCKSPISVQYVLIEALCGALYAGLFYVYYRTTLWPEFSTLQKVSLYETWPIATVHLVLLGGLVAATIIDARLFIIPLKIPYFVVAVTLVVMPVAAVWLPQVTEVAPMVTNPRVVGLAFGAGFGLLVANALVWFKVLPRSFDDEPLEVAQSDAPDAFLKHPHPRLEVLKECLFLVLPVLFAFVSYGLTPEPGAVADELTMPRSAHVLAGVVMGYLVGGAMIWGTRIFGTLAFGKEAMGLGDVHLLGAIGAVLGPRDVMVVFFIAPFLGLVGAAVLAVVGKLLKGETKIIPYGPYLAGATLLVMFAHDPVLGFIQRLFSIS